VGRGSSPSSRQVLAQKVKKRSIRLDAGGTHGFARRLDLAAEEFGGLRG
jgi:hypothetical protein